MVSQKIILQNRQIRVRGMAGIPAPFSEGGLEGLD